MAKITFQDHRYRAQPPSGGLIKAELQDEDGLLIYKLAILV